MKKTVKSPCVNLCSLNDEDICIGCFRTGQEITRWGRLTQREKRDVLIKVRKRESQSPFVSK
ncbi:DUF1289 domain-containing protein [Marinomonas dokdonensis]|uniref:DUF1289 domain-containing protein n=1 Tax=Marinomonas dokdonensis TaxID=328224 RepID=UPI004055724F